MKYRSVITNTIMKFARSDIEEFSWVASAAKHSMEEAHGQVPFLYQPHKHKRRTQGMYSLSSMDRTAATFVPSHQPYCAARNASCVFPDGQMVFVSNVRMCTVQVARNDPLLRLAKHGGKFFGCVLGK